MRVKQKYLLSKPKNRGATYIYVYAGVTYTRVYTVDSG